MRVLRTSLKDQSLMAVRGVPMSRGFQGRNCQAGLQQLIDQFNDLGYQKRFPLQFYKFRSSLLA